MYEAPNIFYQHLVLIPFMAFLGAVFLKWVSEWIKSGKLNVRRALWSGGMPSVHSAVVVSLASGVAIKFWVGSDFFAIASAFTVIIIYDAINVRFEAGLHAKAINAALWHKKFKEHLWHLPSEAFAWSILWIIIALILYYV